ncbi:MAG TPA: DedA family protein [Chloroflexota bacterium]|nr:DedA family protein [Chloroflexota bacterium]
MLSFETSIITFIKHLLDTVGYPGIFLAMLIEGSGIPLPSEITMPFAGFLTTGSHPRFQVPWVIVVGTAAEVCGAGVGYAVGIFGGRPLLERYGKWILISPQDVDRGSAWFDRFGNGIVLVARLLPAVRSYVSIAAGIAEMPLPSFFAFSILGSLIWCTFLTILGRVLGDHWTRISNATRPFEVPIVVGVLVLLAAYLFYRHYWADRQRETPSAQQ